ncbi:MULTISPECIES: hypothetical protein [Rhodopseudomonas]|uniref:hypothetical protein n=1 Tax=Rhodopseudomonas TaxID=1073 RepID=UPI000AAB6C93|nr:MULTISPECIES: hypothetical protein [Rhodopseudomonas]MDF3813966.1 hypothetical protein [Rhodopseudomonas sp. BAL398]WOK19929.1 hypothetical protein RBJ75_10600 [Rhodopseudomonas sp. BAL398]
MGKEVLPDPGQWVSAVERIGIGNTVLLILALGLGVSFVFRGPAYIRAFNEVLATILKYQKEKKRIPNKVENKQQNLNAALDARKRNGRGGST